MTMLTLVHIFLAIVFFFFINWIGDHSAHAGYIKMSILVKNDEAPAFNFLYRSFSPIAFIVLASATCYSFNWDWVVKDIYMVVVYYFAFRLGFNLITGKGRLLNWFLQIAYFVASVPLAYYIYCRLILNKEFLFPSDKELGSALWLAVLAYLYHTINSVQFSSEKTKARKKNYLEHRFEAYKKEFGTIIEKVAKTKKQEILIYAVLIYEAFNRPKIYRMIENLLFRVGLAKTLGIMQVTTNELIDDNQSVEIGSRKIVADYEVAEKDFAEKKTSMLEYYINRKVLTLYNPDGDYASDLGPPGAIRTDLSLGVRRVAKVEGDRAVV